MEEFDLLTDKLRGEVKFLYFHLMGEPLMHRHLADFVIMAKEKGFVPVLTTNGTLIDRRGEDLLRVSPHKIQISLHSHEGNGKEHPEDYIRHIMEYAMKAAASGTVVVLRLWNQGGLDSANGYLQSLLEYYVPRPWTERYDGWKLTENIYLEYDGMFEWPDARREEYETEEVFCYALRNQIGVLVDGSVVPCCLDHNGDIALGNLFSHDLADILASPRAKALYEGFSRHIATEPLCRRCGYAAVAKRFRK
jgi:radical SAM protein with 4Fe4S-binding SPASM domain